MIGEDECVTAIAAVLVHDQLPNTASTIVSVTHGYTFSLLKFVLFLLEKRSRQELREMFVYKRFNDAYQIADGASLWESEDPIIGELRTFEGVA
jgi:hypothetical protein